MAHRRLLIRLACLVGASVFVLGGCKPKGSCDRRADAEKTCTDYFSTIDTTKASCADDPSTHAKGTWSDAPCTHDGALAGCKLEGETRWYWPGAADGRVTKVEHVAKWCSSGTLVDAKGKKLEGVTPQDVPPETRDRFVEELVAKASPKLATFVGAVDKIKATLPSAPPGGTIKPTGADKTMKNAAAVWDVDLRGFGVPESANAMNPITGAKDVRACGLAVKAKKRPFSFGPQDVQHALEWCPTIEYLLVVKPTKLVDVEKDFNNGRFRGGIAEGYVYAFEIPSGTLIGGYSFKAQSSNEADSNEVIKDFRDNIAKALTNGLSKASPTASYTFLL